MYGGGMYGGGMGGMGGMYGGMGGLGGMGGMSSMYGGGLGGMSGGMYGGGLGSGMYGGMGGGGMYGGNGMSGGMYGNSNSFMNQNSGFGTNGLTGGLNGADPNAPPGQGGSLLPTQADGPGSPINQVASTLPPLNETPEERGRRIRAERRKNRQLIHQQREQRRQMQLQAKMEVAGHLTNVLVQTLRSTMELFAVCFGTYYSVKAVRAFANTQQERTQFQRGPNGQMIPVRVAPNSAPQAAAAAGAEGGGGGKGRWKTWLLFGIILIIAEVLYSRLASTFQPKQQPARRRVRARHPVEDEYGNVYTQDEEFASNTDSEEEDDDSLLDSDRGFESEEATPFVHEYTASPTGASTSQADRASRSRRIFQAVYDYQGTGEDGYLSFKAGDEFIVEDYAEGAWCDAMPVDGNHHHSPNGRRGWIPSNFIRPLERTTKL